jgi:hypothetical protein
MRNKRTGHRNFSFIGIQTLNDDTVRTYHERRMVMIGTSENRKSVSLRYLDDLSCHIPLPPVGVIVYPDVNDPRNEIHGRHYQTGSEYRLRNFPEGNFWFNVETAEIDCPKEEEDE